jgi:Flp pilus assembly protein TadG
MMLIFLGVIQFGLIFNAYITLTNATREAAREGSIHVYARGGSETKATNDCRRNETIRTTLLGSMNLLGKSAPQFSTGTTCATWTQSGQTFTNGDIKITYAIPTTLTDSDPRSGQQITVTAAYHQDLIIPLIASLLPRDAGGRLVLTGEVTMVVN